MLYMAYGMNTNRDAMANRCPKAKPLGGFYLPDTRLVFRGVADIVPDPDYICPVVLWRLRTIAYALLTGWRVIRLYTTGARLTAVGWFMK